MPSSTVTPSYMTALRYAVLELRTGMLGFAEDSEVIVMGLEWIVVIKNGKADVNLGLGGC